jgi:CO/xanthine dehydrogenase FAD-binding subunit
VEDALKGSRVSESDVQSAIGTITDLDVDWMSDLQGSQEYRRHLTGVVTARAIQAARGRVQA